MYTISGLPLGYLKIIPFAVKTTEQCGGAAPAGHLLAVCLREVKMGRHSTLLRARPTRACDLYHTCNSNTQGSWRRVATTMPTLRAVWQPCTLLVSETTGALSSTFDPALVRELAKHTRAPTNHESPRTACRPPPPGPEGRARRRGPSAARGRCTRAPAPAPGRRSLHACRQPART
jgi:hypothetical protein